MQKNMQVVIIKFPEKTLFQSTDIILDNEVDRQNIKSPACYISRHSHKCLITTFEGYTNMCTFTDISISEFIAL